MQDGANSYFPILGQVCVFVKQIFVLKGRGGCYNTRIASTQ